MKEKSTLNLSKYNIKEILLVVSGRWGVINRTMMFMEQYPELNINPKEGMKCAHWVSKEIKVLLWPSLTLLGLY